MDLTAMFESAFGKADLIKQQTAHQYHPQGYQPPPGYTLQPIAPQYELVQKSYPEMDFVPKMTPEQRGAARRAQRLQEEKAWLEFLKSITEAEYDVLVKLAKGNVCIPNRTLEQMGEEGVDLGLEKLEKAEAIKRETIPGEDFTEFRILGKGRQILQELR